MDQLSKPILGTLVLPMPTTESAQPYSVGTTVYTPGGHPRTQRSFTGEIITMSWDKLSDLQRTDLRDAIIAAGFNPTMLTLTDGATQFTVIPNSFDSYSESKYEHLIAQTIRWDAKMTWKEVPQ